MKDTAPSPFRVEVADSVLVDLPLLISRGWPGSVFEFYELIPLLTDPESLAATRPRSHARGTGCMGRGSCPVSGLRSFLWHVGIGPDVLCRHGVVYAAVAPEKLQSDAHAPKNASGRGSR